MGAEWGPEWGPEWVLDPTGFQTTPHSNRGFDEPRVFVDVILFLKIRRLGWTWVQIFTWSRMGRNSPVCTAQANARAPALARAHLVVRWT